MSDNYVIPMLEKAFEVLELISNTHEELSLSEISQKLDIPKTTVFRIMTTLQKWGYVEKSLEQETFRLGKILIKMGKQAASDLDIKEISLPYLDELAKETGESANLGILYQEEVLTLANAKNEPELIDEVARLLITVKSGWDAIITKVDESTDKEATEPVTLTVEMNGTTIIPANVISQLRGKNVKLILNMGNGITWTINGMDVEDTELSDIDLGVTRNTSVIPEDVVNGIRGENSSIQIELAHKGAFGFTATLSIAFDSTDAGKYANLFYYNEETGKLEYMESAQVSEDGTATLTFVHASAYSIVLSSAKMDESSITASESKGNNQANDNSKTVTTEVQATDETSGSMMVIWILLGVIVVVVIAGTTIYMKKKKDDKEENEA